MFIERFEACEKMYTYSKFGGIWHQKNKTWLQGLFERVGPRTAITSRETSCNDLEPLGTCGLRIYVQVFLPKHENNQRAQVQDPQRVHFG